MSRDRHPLTSSPAPAPGSRPAARVGTLFAAVVLAVLATPSTQPVRDDPVRHAARLDGGTLPQR